MPQARKLVVLALAAWSATFALGANELVVGVITSRSQAPGAAQALVATTWASQLRTAGGVFGVPVRLLLADDGASAEAAAREATAQIAAGALALVCCTTPAATQAVARVAEAGGVTLLAPVPWQADAAPGYWAFALAPTDSEVLAAIVADAYRRSRNSLALLAPDLPLASQAAEALAALGKLVGIALAADVRYPPGQQELRPEALLVASSRPGAVVVWGSGPDLVNAASALARRGYEGDVYGRSAALYPGAEPLAWRGVAGMLFALPPAAVAASSSAGATVLPGEREGGALGTCAEAAARDAARLEAATGSRAQAVAAAPVLGALDLLRMAFEQLLALQVPLESVAVARQALRDTLVGLPAHCTGAGALDLEDGRTGAVLARSLAIGQATPTGLTAR